MIYLLCTNTFLDFLDYAVFGVSTFTNTTSYGSLWKYGTMYKILSYMLPIAVIIMLIVYICTRLNKNLQEKKLTKNIQILSTYSIASLSVMYPIADRGHFAIGSICVILTTIYLLYEGIYHFIKDKEKIKFGLKTFLKIAAILLFDIYILKGGFGIIKYVQTVKDQQNLKHFSFIPTDEELYKRITNVGEFIVELKAKGKKVYILDTMGAAFIIPTGEYHKNYDMFNIGNFGTRGEDGIIEDLENDEDFFALILKDGYRRNDQLPEKVISYIKENYEYVGEIDFFYIYGKG